MNIDIFYYPMVNRNLFQSLPYKPPLVMHHLKCNVRCAFKTKLENFIIFVDQQEFGKIHFPMS